jgi:hypothetical protein
MIYKDRISQLGEGRWRIQLATHAGTPIPNETSKPSLSLAGIRKQAEERYASIFQAIRPPIAGYNCFGHVFASRRTAIYEEDGFDIETLLAEDGFGEVVREDDLRVGDVALFRDDRGVTHAARVIRIEQGPVVLSGDSAACNTRVPFLISKFDSVSGEYEHRLDDTRWIRWPVTRTFFRDRESVPVYPHGWRAAIKDLGG